MTNKKLTFLICVLVSVFFFQYQSFGQSTTFKSGTAIIDMGSASPTVKNSLKPYGLVYTLLKNNYVPVNYVVNAAKVKDGIDFAYNGKSYKGGTFIISAEYISSNVTSVLSSWANQGVLIDYTNSDLTVDVTYKINFIPKWVMDKANGNIAVGFLNAAGIPSSAYSFKDPSQLGGCEDLFVLPHADPTWATHSNLFVWNRDNKGAIWAGCHAVSVLENLVDPNNPSNKMNFLSTNGLVPFTDHSSTSIPFSNLLPGDPVSQFLGKTDNAQINGSENVYLPKIGSIWNTGAKIITSSPSQGDVPALSSGTPVENIYGRAFNNSARGYVAYQASHNIGGTSADQIAAQRIFFNFSLFALNDKIPPIISVSLSGGATQLTAGLTSGTLTSNVTGTGTGLIYQWSSNVTGIFSNPTGQTTTFTSSASITSATPCILTCVVTESCGRTSFDSKKITIIPPPATHLLTNINIVKNIADGCTSPSTTFNVFDGNPDPDAGARTLLSVTGLGNGTVITSTSGDITFTAASNFKGTTSGTFIVTNGISNSPSGNITITVGDPTLAPVLTNDVLTALVDQVTNINVLANDKNNNAAANGGLLYIRDIPTKPTKGYVYINIDGTLSYLSKKDQTPVTGGDSFQYLACNNIGYCSVGSVSVTLVQDACSANMYQITSTLSTSIVSFTPTADSYVSAQTTPNDSTTTNNSTLAYLRLNGLGSQSRRILVKFDISSIPSIATVNSATLSMVVGPSGFTINGSGSNNPFPATIYSVIPAWTETGVTYKKYNGTTNWANSDITTILGNVTDLGASNPTLDGPFANSSTTNASTSVGATVTSIVSAWVLSSTSNGFMIVPRASGSLNINFFSKEQGTSSNFPKLTVNYTAPSCFTIPTSYIPIVYPDATATTSALSVTFSPLSNDDNYYTNTNALLSLTTPANGTAVISGNNIIYTPNGSFVGIDTLTYTARDQSNTFTNTSTVRITVSRVAPTILNDVATTPSNTAKTIVVGANDIDPQSPGTLSAPVIVTIPKNGIAMVVGNDVVYTPTTGFVGTDNFTYSRSGAAADVCTTALAGTATVTITVTNQLPVANNFNISTFACAPVTINLNNNATDPEAGLLTVTIVGNPASGTLTSTGAGIYKYTPNTSFTGTDNFTYSVTDPLNATSNIATCTITVTGTANPNSAPIAVADADKTLVNQLVYTNVLFNDSDPNSDPLSVSITALGLTAPLSGTIQLMPNKLIKYTPNNGFVGTDTYQYQLTDTHPSCTVSSSLSSIATVTITVTSLPTTLSGTVYNDADNSGQPDFSGIKTGSEIGTNGNGSIYVYVIDNSNIIIDRTPVDVDGTYTLSNVPSLSSNLKLILSNQDLALGSTLTAGSLPTGYSNSSPLIRSLPTTTLADMGPYNWGIYINPLLSPGIIVAPANICGTSGIPGTITATANATGGSLTSTRYSYQWESSTTSVSSGFAAISAADTLTTYAPTGAISATTYFRRSVATRAGSSNSNIDGPLYSNVVTVTLNPNPTISASTLTATISVGGSATLTAGGAGTYVWSPSAGLSATNTAVVTASPITTTFYTVTGTVTATGCINTASITVTVINPGVITGDQSGCGTFTPTTITSTSDASGATGITYQWQSSTTSTTTGFTNIVGATASGYSPIAISTTTYYRRVATSGGFSFNSNAITKTVVAQPTVTISPTTPTINISGNITLTAGGASTYVWSPSAGLSATNTAVVTASPITTTFYTVTGTVIATGCINTANITVTVINPGAITGDQSGCGTFTPTTITSTSDASGATGITYQWQSSTTSTTTGFTNIVGATASGYSPVAISTTTYYRRVATSGGFSFNSNAITKTQNALPGITVSSPNNTIIIGSSQVITASGASTYVWSPSTSLSATNTASVTANPSATITYTVTGTNTTTGCVNTAAITITVVSGGGNFIAGTIGSDQTICIGSTPVELTSITSGSGGTGSINYQWQQSTDNINFTNITGAVSATYAPPALSQKTYYRRGASTNSDPTLYTGSVTITTVSPPVITGINGPCAIPKDSTKTFSVSAAVPSATNYVWTIPSGWSGSSTTNSINIKGGAANGTISVVPFNGSCAGNTVTYSVAIIDYAKVTISGTPVIASGNNNNPIKVAIQLIDVSGNLINCSGGVATLCTNSGTFTTVVDNNDGTYTSFLTSSANDVTICGTVGGIPVLKTTKVTFTGPQGGIKGNGPILATEIPKITFTATAGRAPFTVIYRSAKSNKNDTLTNYTSGTAIGVALIPSTTLYTLVSVIDANGERRDNNFNRDTATIIVVAPRIIVTLHADPAVLGNDSSWSTRLSLHVKNIGDLDLSAVQVKLNLKDVFPNPVTYVLDSVRVNGSTVVANKSYDGIQSNDLFSRLNNKIKNRLPADINVTGLPDIAPDLTAASPVISNAIDNATGILQKTNGIEVYGNTAQSNTETEATTFADEEHSVYMFGAASQLPVGVESTMFLYIHLKPNGYYEPFLMQAVALGTGSTAEATALTSSLSNDNNDVNAHPDLTKKGDPLPTVINLIPNPVIGASMSAGSAVDQGNGTYNVLLSFKLKNYGNVNLQTLKLFLNLGRMIGSPATFTIVGAITTTGTLVPNPAYDGKIDSNLLITTSELAYKQEGTIQFTINITPNQLSSLYRLQATANAFNTDVNGAITDLSTDGADPDPDGDSKPVEKVITIIAINLPIPPLVPGIIGILVNPSPRTTVPAKTYCGFATGVVVVSNTAATGGSGPFEYQWQSSVNNSLFTDIANATDSIYTTGTVTGNIYLRRKVVSDNQVGYTNSVFLQISPVVKPVISASGPLVLGQNGSVTLTSTTASNYSWSNAATTQSILVTVATVGSYRVTATDANGCPAVSDPVLVTPPPPVTVNAVYIIGALNNPPNSGVQVTGFPTATVNYYILSSGGTLISVPVLPSVIGVYTYYVSQTINGFESVLVPYTVTMIDPAKVSDIQKVLSKAPVLQSDGSFLLSFTILSSNLRAELLDSVKIKDDLSKVFPAFVQYQVVDLKASGKLISNGLYNGTTQIDMLTNGSQLPGFQTDSIQLTLKVFANGFAGTLNNVAEQTAKSLYGIFKVTSNDPTVGSGTVIRAPTKFIIPLVDIFIPSGFSPNHDGTNDLFVITRPYNVSISLDIFNRWGNLVYKVADYKNEWDGKGNQAGVILGEDLPDGTYYYIVLATDKSTGSVRKFAGYITLKR